MQLLLSRCPIFNRDAVARRFPRHRACETLEILVPHSDSSQREGIKKICAQVTVSRNIRIRRRIVSPRAFESGSFRGTFVGTRLMKILNDFSHDFQLWISASRRAINVTAKCKGKILF